MGDLATIAALGALRAVTARLEEGDGLDPRAVLSMLLGGGPVAVATSTPAVVVQADEDEAPAPKRKARAKPKARPAAVVDADVPALVARLVEAHGGISAAGRAIETSPALLRRWRAGAPLTQRSLEKLRAAVEVLPVDDEADDQGDDAAPGESEAASLVAVLEALHGGLASAAIRFGFEPAVLTRLREGGPCSPGLLGRLRAAASVPAVGAPRRRLPGDGDGEDPGRE